MFLGTAKLPFSKNKRNSLVVILNIFLTEYPAGVKNYCSIGSARYGASAGEIDLDLGSDILKS